MMRKLGAKQSGISKQKKMESAANFALTEICSNPDSPAAARVAAARTLLELSGRLGRHQEKPSTYRVSEMSLEQMLDELNNAAETDKKRKR